MAAQARHELGLPDPPTMGCKGRRRYLRVRVRVRIRLWAEKATEGTLPPLTYP